MGRGETLPYLGFDRVLSLGLDQGVCEMHKPSRPEARRFASRSIRSGSRPPRPSQESLLGKSELDRCSWKTRSVPEGCTVLPTPFRVMHREHQAGRRDRDSFRQFGSQSEPSGRVEARRRTMTQQETPSTGWRRRDDRPCSGFVAVSKAPRETKGVATGPLRSA